MTIKNSARLPWQQYRAYREVVAYPEAFQSARFSLGQLKTAAKSAEALFRGSPFVFIPDDGFEVREQSIAAESMFGEQEGAELYFGRWELHQSGLFFHRAVMDEETRPDARQFGKVLDFHSTVYHVSETIGSLWRLYMTLGLADHELLTVRFQYTDMEQRRFVILDRRFGGARRPRQAASTAIIERGRRELLGTWRGSDADIAAALITDILERAGWEQPNTDEITRMTHEFLGRAVV